MSSTSVESLGISTRVRRVGRELQRAANVVSGLVLFLLALELVKRGAAGLAPVLRQLDVTGLHGALGFGWLMACVVLSGSPVAAVALALLAGGTLVPRECLAMIVGSRLGASFVVLLVGALDDLRARRRDMRSAYVGVTALVATALSTLPALGVGLHALHAGWLGGFQIPGRQIASFVSLLFGPVTAAAAHLLHPILVFVTGVVTLLVAFRVFDGALPEAAGQRRALFRARGLLERPALMFAAGLVVTAISMSVSMSLSILVPLVAKGYFRRENLWPYVLGANITTFDDTLFAAALVGHPDAARIVLLLMAAVTLLSAPLVFLAPRGFGSLLDRVACRITRDAVSLAAFALFVLAFPALLIAL